MYLSDLVLRTSKKRLPQDSYAFTSSGEGQRSPIVRIGAGLISGSFSSASTILRRRRFRSSLETSRYSLEADKVFKLVGVNLQVIGYTST